MQTVPHLPDNKAPLISFVIPCYNLPVELLRQCVASITELWAEFGRQEIIVIDDGSQPSVATSFGPLPEGMRIIRQANSGTAVARNLGLDTAQGRYLQFVDGDDCLLTEAYRRIIRLLQADKPDMLAFAHVRHLPAKPVKHKVWHTTGRRYVASHNIASAVWSYVAKRELAAKLRFATDLKYEDEDFTPRLYLNVQSLTVTDLPAYYYRQRTGSTMKTSSDSQTRRRLDDSELVILRLASLSAALPDNPLERRVAQLTMDYTYNILRLTHSSRELHTRVRRLRQRGLYPTPLKAYTAKYLLWRLAAWIF